MIYRYYPIVPFFLASLFFLFATSCGESTSNPAESNIPEPTAPATGDSDGTAQMITLINDVVKKLDPKKISYYKNEERADNFRKLMEASTNNKDMLNNQMFYGFESLNAGNNDLAVIIFEDLMKKAEQLNMQETSVYLQILHLVAMSYIRLGEQDNCISNYNPDRCIMPFEGKGVYEIQQAVRTGIKYYEKILTINPADYKAVWMLNFAYMTLGEFPDKVPAQWRLKESEFKSDYQLPRFPNIADKIGLNTVALAGGTCIEDFNNDGYLDIFASSWGFKDQIRFFKNNGDGSFSDMTQDCGLKGLPGGLNMVHTDYNNDGFADLFILRGAWYDQSGKIPNSLLRNNGDGTFTDVTIAAGLLSYYPTQAAVWADFNNDGFLDLFIGNEAKDDNVHYPCEMFMNNRDGTFTNRIEESGLKNINAMTKGVTAADANNDGWTDIYLSFLNANNRLFINQGVNSLGFVTFNDPPMKEAVGEPAASFPCWFFDFNNDGWEDIFVASYGYGGPELGRLDAAEVAAQNYLGKYAGGNPKLYRNKGDGTYEDIAEKAGLTDGLFAMGCNYGDIDNDGWLDFYIGTGTPNFSAVIPNKMYRNQNGQFFQDVTTAGGFGHVQKGHGIAFGDLDNDGDQDIFAVIGGAFEGDVFGDALFINPMGNQKSWITLKLEGTISNRAAIGARVKLTTINASGKERTIYNRVSTGASFGANSLQLEIGLDDAVKIKSIEVKWPNLQGTVEVFQNVEINKFVRIREGSGTFEYENRKSFTFPAL